MAYVVEVARVGALVGSVFLDSQILIDLMTHKASELRHAQVLGGDIIPIVDGPHGARAFDRDRNQRICQLLAVIYKVCIRFVTEFNAVHFLTPVRSFVHGIDQTGLFIHDDAVAVPGNGRYHNGITVDGGSDAFIP